MVCFICLRMSLHVCLSAILILDSRLAIVLEETVHLASACSVLIVVPLL